MAKRDSVALAMSVELLTTTDVCERRGVSSERGNKWAGSVFPWSQIDLSAT